MGQTSLHRAVIGIETSGALQGFQIGGDVGPIKMELVHSAPNEKHQDNSDAQGACARRGAGEPIKRGRERGRVRFGWLTSLPFIQEEARDTRIAKLPNDAIKKEMVKIDERGEREKAGGKVGVKQTAGEPGTGDKESNAAGDERQKIAREAPGDLTGGASLLLLVIAGDPQILRGMKHRKDAAGITGLRNLFAAKNFDRSRKQEPKELGGSESEARQQGFPGAATRQRAKCPGRGAQKEQTEHGANGQGELFGQAQRDDQRVAGRARVKAEKQHEIGSDKR